MSLKEITKELHKQAEHTKAAKLLVSGDITKDVYASWLYQLIMVYGPIEFGNKIQGFFDNFPPDFERLPSLYQDFLELADSTKTYTWLPSTVAYHAYLIDLINDPARKHLIKAHSYVRHMGDLSGGQLVATRVPGTVRFYKFTDIDTLKPKLRAGLTDELGAEACVAFEWNIKIMKEFGGE
jgi:heme oxygenase